MKHIIHILLVALSAACVDAGAPKQPPATAASAAAASAMEEAKKKEMGEWLETRTRSEMDGTLDIHLFVSATPGSHGTMTIRCARNRTSVDVYAGDTVFRQVPNVPVRVRFDQKPAERQVWRGSTDMMTLYAPRPVAFARRLASAREFRLEYPNPEGPGWVVLYEVHGLSKRLGSIADACNWKYTPPAGADSAPGGTR